jgi:hypothetical protein
MVILRLYKKKTLQHLTERCNQPKPTIKSRNGVKTNQDINSFKRWRGAFASNIRPYLVRLTLNSSLYQNNHIDTHENDLTLPTGF